MIDAYIHFIFPHPGDWGNYNMFVSVPDAAGYVQTVHYTPATLPADQAPELAAVVDALVGLAAPWQAAQVWAHLMTATVYNEDDPYTPTGQRDEVVLDVEAVHAETGGRRIFTPTQYQEFIVTDPAAVAFFKHFTKQ